MLEKPVDWTARILTPELELWESPDGNYKTLRTRIPFAAGVPILDFGAAEFFAKPVRYSLQFSKDEHALLDPEFLKFVNHSCSPTILFDLDARKVKTLSDLPARSEMLCFYPSTEWDMDQPFACNCGNPQCLGLIRGAAAMDPDALENYTLSAHIRELLGSKEAVKSPL